jgi:hypothetical protein
MVAALGGEVRNQKEEVRRKKSEGRPQRKGLIVRTAASPSCSDL